MKFVVSVKRFLIEIEVFSLSQQEKGKTMMFLSSLKVIVDALTGHLLNTLHDSLGSSLDLLVFILKQFR